MINHAPARLGIALALVAVVAACGGPGQTTSDQVTQRTSVSVGLLPINEVAALYLGIRRGFFEQQRLDVRTQVMQSGPAVTSAVIGGSLDFGYSGAASLILARAQGLPVKMVASGATAARDPAQDWSAIMVSGSSSMTSVREFSGRTVASNALKGVNELGIDSAALAAGLNPSTLKIAPMDFADMPAALSEKRVDAIAAPEPWVTVIESQGGRVLSPMFSDLVPGGTVSTYFTTDREIQEHPAVVRSFAKAMQESLAYASGHPADARRIISTYTRTSPAVLSRIRLTSWNTRIDRPSIAHTAALIRQLGWTRSDVSAASLIWSGAS